MKHKRYIWVEGVPRKPDSAVLTRKEKEARIIALADKMKVKIGNDNKREDN